MPRVDEVPQVQQSQLWFPGLEPKIEVDMKALDEYADSLSTIDRAENTIINYKSHFAVFQRWCESVHMQSLPTDSLTLRRFASYQLQVRKLKVNTVRNHLSAIRYIHITKGYQFPAMEGIKNILRAEKRKRRETPVGKDPITIEELREISRRLKAKGRPIDIRDRAIMVLGFISALRRTNLAELDIQDVRITRKGVRVWVPYSKTDQTGKGTLLGLARGSKSRPNTCPVRTLEDWLKLRGADPGPLFSYVAPSGEVSPDRKVHGRVVAAAVKRAVQLIGREPQNFGGHSLRASLVTAAKQAKAPDSAIMKRTGHTNLRTLAIYDRNVDPFAGTDPLAKIL